MDHQFSWLNISIPEHSFNPLDRSFSLELHQLDSEAGAVDAAQLQEPMEKRSMTFHHRAIVFRDLPVNSHLAVLVCDGRNFNLDDSRWSSSSNSFSAAQKRLDVTCRLKKFATDSES